MSKIWFLLAVCCFSGVLSLTHPTYLIREHRTNLKSLPAVQNVASNRNQYQLVSADDYALVEHPTEASFMDYVLSPVNAVVNVGSRVLPLARWVIVNGAQVLFGVAMTIGLCVFTSSCTVTLDNPFSRSFPYLDNIQNIFNVAYDTYQNLQNAFSA